MGLQSPLYLSDPKAQVWDFKEETKNEGKPGSHQSRKKVKVLAMAPPNNWWKANSSLAGRTASLLSPKVSKHCKCSEAVAAGKKWNISPSMNFFEVGPNKSEQLFSCEIRWSYGLELHSSWPWLGWEFFVECWNIKTDVIWHMDVFARQQTCTGFLLMQEALPFRTAGWRKAFSLELGIITTWKVPVSWAQVQYWKDCITSLHQWS